MDTKRGGARKGAGRPVEGHPKRQVTVNLDQTTEDALKRLGGGNLSLGIRLAAARCCE